MQSQCQGHSSRASLWSHADQPVVALWERHNGSRASSLWTSARHAPLHLRPAAPLGRWHCDRAKHNSERSADLLNGTAGDPAPPLPSPQPSGLGHGCPSPLPPAPCGAPYGDSNAATLPQDQHHATRQHPCGSGGRVCGSGLTTCAHTLAIRAAEEAEQGFYYFRDWPQKTLP